MSRGVKGQSKYILGQIGYSQIADMPIGSKAVVVLNPFEREALQRASASFKASVCKVKKGCVLESQMILVSTAPGVWTESRILTVTIIAAPTAQQEPDQ